MELPINYNKAHWSIRKKARLQYIEEQDNKCYYCECDLDGDPPINVINTFVNWKLFPKGFRKNPIHLHHCRKTGMTLGAVHMYCNAVLWVVHRE